MGSQDDVNFSYVEVQRAKVIAIANVHLPSDSYGPELVRDGSASWRTCCRAEADNRHVRAGAFRGGAAQGRGHRAFPVIVGGDFNSPSHLDWTDAVAKARPDAVKYPVEWPESKLMADSGFVDSYRAVHADPVAKPGLTWTPGYPHPFVRPQETHDRIDYIYAIGAKAIASQVVGEVGGPDVEISVNPWPADHRGLLTTFEVEPAPIPGPHHRRAAIGAAGRECSSCASATQKQEKLGVTSADLCRQARRRMRPLITSVPADPADHLAAPFGTAKPGRRARISPPSPMRTASASPANAVLGDRSQCAKPDRRGGQAASVKSGDPIEVSWNSAPGNKFDWIGIYSEADPDLYNYLGYLYTNASVAGAVTFKTEDFGDALAPGDYEARLMRDDAYVELAVVKFTVTE